MDSSFMNLGMDWRFFFNSGVRGCIECQYNYLYLRPGGHLAEPRYQHDWRHSPVLDIRHMADLASPPTVITRNK